MPIVPQFLFNALMVNMKTSLTSVILLFHTVFAQTGFGNSYLKNTKLCNQWTCLNEKLHLPDALPPRNQYTQVLKTILPPEWQGIVDKTLDVCYGDKPRRYVNTCPGQALLHCVIDQFIQNCPEENWRKDDACAPLSTLAGFKYMFSQSRYENLEKNLPTERRPPWFLKNYFNSKCCDLPTIFNSTMLSECNFTSLIFYHVHSPRNTHVGSPAAITPNTKTTQTLENRETVKVVDLPIPSTDKEVDLPVPSTVKIDEQLIPSPVNVVDEPPSTVKVVDESSPSEFEDPLECCDLSAYINPSWASECDFQLTWTGKDRLVIKNTSKALDKDEPTKKEPKFNDVKVVPLSCEEETCIFSRLNILTASGSVDLDAFSKLLDNMTNSYPMWTKAKGRVITKCLTKPLLYDQPCEVNKVLACTLDVLSENCPHAKKADPCKHSNIIKEDITCQISSSKYRPKNRRQFCGVPNLVNHEVLSQCGVKSLSRLDYVPDPPVTSKPKYGWSRYACKETSTSTKCLLNKMGVLNKYGFLDYFKMKDHIRTLGLDPVWSSLSEIYQSAFTGMPLYGEYCSSPRKFLNVLDAMLTTCPISKRKHTQQCNLMFTDMMTKAPINTECCHDRQKLNQTINRIRHIFLPLLPRLFSNHTYINPSKVPNIKFQIPKQPKVIRNEQYDFGILNSKDVPPVKIIDVNPKSERKPLILLPVYLRVQKRVINGTKIGVIKPVLDVKNEIGMVEMAKP